MVVEVSAADSLSASEGTSETDGTSVKHKRIPLVIQRTISTADIYDVPGIPIIFVLGNQPQFTMFEEPH